MKKKTLKKPVFKLQTYNWNERSKREQDNALLYMHRVLVELSERRKFGYAKDFWAQI